MDLGLYIRGKVYQVVYENLPSLYHGCGRVGHSLGECMYKQSQNNQTNIAEQVSTQQNTVIQNTEERENAGGELANGKSEE